LLESRQVAGVWWVVVVGRRVERQPGRLRVGVGCIQTIWIESEEGIQFVL
jgi:hypothetical protein